MCFQIISGSCYLPAQVTQTVGRAEMSVTLHNADCRAVSLPPVDVVITDPPYPNRAEHFVDDIPAAIEFLQTYQCKRWFVFWDEMEIPPVPLPLVARHVWHRSNTNRPDNYEAIFEFNADGVKRASRVFSFPVIALGLTGCTEALGHPTQKNSKMIARMITDCRINGVVLDPFMGVGSTGLACVKIGLPFIGVEKDKGYFDMAQSAIAKARKQMSFHARPTPLALDEGDSAHLPGFF